MSSFKKIGEKGNLNHILKTWQHPQMVSLTYSMCQLAPSTGLHFIKQKFTSTLCEAGHQLAILYSAAVIPWTRQQPLHQNQPQKVTEITQRNLIQSYQLHCYRSWCHVRQTLLCIAYANDRGGGQKRDGS